MESTQLVICFVFYLYSLGSAKRNIFTNNYCMANNRWGILLSALNLVAYQLHYFIHSFLQCFFFFFVRVCVQSSLSRSLFFLFFVFLFFSCHSVLMKACRLFKTIFIKVDRRTRLRNIHVLENAIRQKKKKK